MLVRIDKHGIHSSGDPDARAWACPACSETSDTLGLFSATTERGGSYLGSVSLRDHPLYLAQDTSRCRVLDESEMASDPKARVRSDPQSPFPSSGTGGTRTRENPPRRRSRPPSRGDRVGS